VSGKDGMTGLRRWQKRNAEISAEWAEANRAWIEANREMLEQRSREDDRAEAIRRRARVSAAASKRRAAEMQRTPAWADLNAIRKVYEQAQAISRATGVKHHVDHVVPLQGENVSGLHVHTNLQILTRSENVRKGNRHEP
jgi:hypothetical protein